VAEGHPEFFQSVGARGLQPHPLLTVNEPELFGTYHVPVMVAEATRLLVSRPDGSYIDATFGGGGHTRRILRELDAAARLTAIDCDDEALARGRDIDDRRLTLVRGNFRDIDMLAAQTGSGQIDGVLFDLGVSSHQFDDPGRGFGYNTGQLLDMRMDRRLERSAAMVLNQYPAEKLADLFFYHADITWSRRLARAVVAAREKAPLQTSDDLAAAALRVANRRLVNKVLARVFQAVRIEVNRETEALTQGLAKAVGLLAPGGRVVVLAYHSVEDRIVKHYFRNCAAAGTLSVLTRRPLVAGAEEAQINPRSRSAKLRAAARI
jgi:16S rRNA (cytosine1402-N4)-methyltransferase